MLYPILGKIKPAQAVEHPAKALVLSCIDFRFISLEQEFLSEKMRGKYDWVALAGASLALTGFPHAAEAEVFWDQLELSTQLHGIQKVIILDHQDCGAYTTYLNADLSQDPGREYDLHREYLQQAKNDIQNRYLQLITEGYFLELAGNIRRVV